ncbi:MAG: sulfotransferase [Deltaproteobacteria bacterium]|nr:sulfotransferase [Deltaproteobacteria bacterium]
MHVELTNACDFRCDFCPQPTQERGPQSMDLGVLRRTIDDLVDSGVTGCIGLHVLGEPLLYPHLFDAIAHAKDRGLRVELTTNGWKLDAERLGHLAELQLDLLTISLVGTDPSAHVFRGARTSFDAYYARILDAVRVARRLRPPVPVRVRVLSTWSKFLFTVPHPFRHNHSRRELRACLVRLVGDLSEANNGQRPSEEVRGAVEGVLGRRDVVLGLGEGVDVFVRSFSDWGNAFAEGEVCKARFGYCPAALRTASVLANGDVVPCCTDYDGKAALGNIREASFVDLLSGPTAQEIYRGFQRGRVVHPRCPECLGSSSPAKALFKGLGTVPLFGLHDPINARRIDLFPGVNGSRDATEARLVGRALGRTGDALLGMGLPVLRLEEDALIEAARAEAGLDDFGGEEFRVGLRRFLDSAATDARLNFFGRLTARNAVVTTLVNRLRFVQERKRAPEVLWEPVRNPIVIASLPRTGTTLLQRLLAAHPDALYVPMWLGMRSMPPPDEATWRAGGGGARLRASRLTTLAVRMVAPAMMRKHEVGPRLPVECSYLMMGTFAAMQWWAVWPVYRYGRWFVHQDPEGPHQIWREHLQLLQGALPGDHWVLKSPGHFFCLDTVLKTLPNARVVMLHRDPIRVMASTHSLFETAHGSMTRHLDLAEVVRLNTRALSEASKQVVEVREEADPDRFMDVQYVDLVADPLGTARSILGRCGVRWDAEVEHALRARLRACPPDKHGSHHYDIADYGQSPDQIRALFARYTKRFHPAEGV